MTSEVRIQSIQRISGPAVGKTEYFFVGQTNNMFSVKTCMKFPKRRPQFDLYLVKSCARGSYPWTTSAEY